MRIVYILLFAGLLWSIGLKGQESLYNRSAVSLMLLGYEDALQSPVYSSFASLLPDSRYDKNIIATKVLPFNGSRLCTEKDNNTGEDKIKNPDRSEVLTDMLNSRNVGAEVIAYIYNRQADGRMDAGLINQRAAYNKTDADYNVIQATAKKQTGLQEGGEALIRNSYIMLYDYANLRCEYAKVGEKGDVYWKGDVTVYLFRVAWTDELRQRFYEECWIDDETPEEQRKAICEQFSKFQVPVELTMKQSRPMNKETGIEAFRKLKPAVRGKLTENDLRINSLQTGVIDCFSSLQNEVETRNEAFNIKCAVENISPIQAKIGLKEGVRTNLRFYMYEYSQKGGGAISRRRKGVVRATNKITDNRGVTTGNMVPTEFYQIAGKAAQPGWEMQEKKSWGMNLELGYQLGNQHGVYAGLTGSIYGRKNFNHFLMLGYVFGMDQYEIKWKPEANVDAKDMEYRLQTIDFNYGYGLVKRNWEVYPYLGVGLNTMMSKEKEDETTTPRSIGQKNAGVNPGEAAKEEKTDFIDETAWKVNAGIRLVVNICYPVQMSGSAGYSTPIHQGNSFESVRKANSDFDKAVSGLSYRLGLRICF